MIRRCEELFKKIQHTSVGLRLVVILSFSFLLKLLCWHLEPTISRDGGLYIHLAQIWYDTGSYQQVLDAWSGFWIPPLSLYVMKSLMHLGISAETAGVAISLVTGTFAPLICYGIAFEVTQKKAIAWGAALLTAVSPAINTLSIEVQREMIYLFFAGIALWLLCAGIRRSGWRYWIGAGIACGCAMLVRFETLEFLFIVPVALLYLSLAKYWSWKKTLSCTTLFFFCLCVTVTALAFLMKTENDILSKYKSYYRGKIMTVKGFFLKREEP